MMNLFENLQIMKEYKNNNKILKEAKGSIEDFNKNDIITIKVSGLATMSELSEENKEWCDWIEDDYSLKIIDNGNTDNKTGYVTIKGTVKNIDTFLSEVAGFSYEDNEVELIKVNKTFNKLTNKDKNIIKRQCSEDAKIIFDEIDSYMNSVGFTRITAKSISQHNYKIGKDVLEVGCYDVESNGVAIGNIFCWYEPIDDDIKSMNGNEFYTKFNELQDFKYALDVEKIIEKHGYKSERLIKYSSLFDNYGSGIYPKYDNGENVINLRISFEKQF